MGKNNSSLKKISSIESKNIQSTTHTNTIFSIVGTLILIFSVIAYNYSDSKPSQTPSQKRDSVPKEWGSALIWSLVDQKKDEVVFRTPIKSAGYSSIKVLSKDVRSNNRLQEYGIDFIRYLVLEPSIGVQGFSCVKCNSSGYCQHAFNRKLRDWIPPCLMEPTQAMLNLAIASPNDLNCKNSSRVLMLGFGNGAMSSYIDFFFPKWKVDIVEITPELCTNEILNLFGNHPNSTESSTTLFVEDAKKFVMEKGSPCSESGVYDLILLDMAGADASPPFMSDSSWIRALRCLLKSNGMVLANMLGSTHQDPQAATQITEIVDQFVRAFGKKWNLYFSEASFFNRILIVSRSPLPFQQMRSHALESSNRCETPPLFRGTDFVVPIDSSSPSSRQKWISLISDNLTRKAMKK